MKTLFLSLSLSLEGFHWVNEVITLSDYHIWVQLDIIINEIDCMHNFCMWKKNISSHLASHLMSIKSMGSIERESLREWRRKMQFQINFHPLYVHFVEIFYWKGREFSHIEIAILIQFKCFSSSFSFHLSFLLLSSLKFYLHTNEVDCIQSSEEKKEEEEETRRWKRKKIERERVEMSCECEKLSSFFYLNFNNFLMTFKRRRMEWKNSAWSRVASESKRKKSWHTVSVCW